MSDSARANWSSLAAVLVGIGAAVLLAVTRGNLGSLDALPFVTDVYLVMWPVFTAIYLTWTHLGYSRRPLGALTPVARPAKRHWWQLLFSYGGASSWTLTAALVAIFLTVVIAQNSSYRSNALYIVLGLLSVASSWALMVYSFALRYLRLDAEGASTGQPNIELELELDGEARFSDYLTFAILLSTMAATVSAHIRTRRAWLAVRTNVLFAFTFNSVIVAMVVSLLIGGLLA